MKKKLFVLFLTVLLLLLPMTAYADAIIGTDFTDGTDVDYSVIVDAPDGYVNFRMGPGTNYEVISRIDNGVRLHVVRVYGDSWGLVNYGNYTGWIALSQVTRGTYAPMDSEYVSAYDVVVAAPDDYVNFRTGPGTEHPIICPIDNGVILRVSAKHGSWGYTTYQGSEGWIALSQVSENVPTPTPTPAPEPSPTPTVEPTETPASEPTAAATPPYEPIGKAIEEEPQPTETADAEPVKGTGFGKKLLWILIGVAVVGIGAAAILLFVLPKKQGIECPYCGALNPKGSAFCSKCGCLFPSQDEE